MEPQLVEIQHSTLAMAVQKGTIFPPRNWHKTRSKSKQDDWRSCFHYAGGCGAGARRARLTSSIHHNRRLHENIPDHRRLRQERNIPMSEPDESTFGTSPKICIGLTLQSHIWRRFLDSSEWHWFISRLEQRSHGQHTAKEPRRSECCSKVRVGW